MAETKLKGNPVQLKGDLPQEGSEAPDFTYVKGDLSEGKLSDHQGRARVLISVPSLETSVCATETKRFNEELSEMGVKGLVISKDLPFAQGRFCEAEGISNVDTVSDFRYGEFCDKYNVEMTDGPMKGLTARTVLVVDPEGKVRYTEIVPEIGQEPDYDRILDKLQEVVA